MPFELNAFLDDVLKDVQVDKAQVATLLSNPEVLKRLEESVMRQGDYSKRMSDLQKANTEVQTYRTQLETWKSSADTELATAKAHADALRRATAEAGLNPADYLSQTSGSLPKPNGEGEPTDSISRKEFEATVSNIQTQGVGLMASMNKIGMKHFTRFKEVLDTDVLVQLSLQKNVPIDVAYQMHIEPFVQKEQTALMEQIKKDSFEEGRRSVIANTNFPTDTSRYGDVVNSLDRLDNKIPNEQVGWKSAADALSKKIFSGATQ